MWKFIREKLLLLKKQFQENESFIDQDSHNSSTWYSMNERTERDYPDTTSPEIKSCNDTGSSDTDYCGSDDTGSSD